MEIHLIDGTYELFRHYYAVPSARDADGRGGRRRPRRRRLGARHDQPRRDPRRRRDRPRHRVVPQPALARLQDRRRHRARSARAVPAARRRARRARASWSGRWSSSRPTMRWRRRRRRRRADPRVERVIICTPDKDLAQCVRGTRVVQLNRRTERDSATRRRSSRSSASARRRFPTTSRSSATPRTAIPGCPAGARSRRRPCWRRFGHLEAIPDDWREWRVNAANAGDAGGDARARPRARASVPRSGDAAHRHPVFGNVDELRWNGPTPAFARLRGALRRGGHGGAPAQEKREQEKDRNKRLGNQEDLELQESS